MTTETAVFVPPRKESLYSIGAAFDALEALCEEIEAGATEQDADVIAQFLAELDGKLQDKLRGCIAWSKEQEARADAATNEARRLSELARVRKARVERLKKAIRELFEAQGITRVDTDLGACRLVKNGGKPPVIVDEGADLTAMPDHCTRVVVEPIKEELRKVIEAGTEIPGVRIGEVGKSLRLG